MQSSIKDGKQRLTVPGPVLITKNPCVHPGDVRKVDTLTKEKDPDRFAKLSHLYNVIVFPSKGARPLQNMMSGGDLDGDVYMCIWDKELVDAVKEENICEPAAVDSLVKTVQDANMKLATLYDHIGYYLKNDTLGELSNLHVAMCDKLGPKHPDCIEVAAMISVQVDFAKHSECISREAFQAVKKRVEAYPDYLGNKNDQNKKTYESQHVLGQMYRNVKIDEYYEQCTRMEYVQSIKYDY